MLQAFLHPSGQGGHRLYLHHTSNHGPPARAALLYIHPWAEEMNKSRRMAAQASRLLAAQGHAVLQLDLAGCGDSSGEFAQASWALWLDDVVEAARWLRARHPDAPLWLWGLRSGALLAAQAAARLAEPVNLLFWQPVQQGKTFLQQFMRLKAAAQLADGGGKAVLDAARADLAAGRPIEVAGYTLTQPLCDGLAQASLQSPVAPVAGASQGGQAATAPSLVWLECSPQAMATLSPAALATLPKWQATGWRVHSAAVQGPAFWQTTEIEDAPALWQATVDQLAGAPRAATPDSRDAAAQGST